MVLHSAEIFQHQSVFSYDCLLLNPNSNFTAHRRPSFSENIPCYGRRNATVASVIATVEDNTEVTVPRKTTRSQSARLNLAATFKGFAQANNPNA